MAKTLNLEGIANRIDAYLTRFYADPVANAETNGHRPYYHPAALRRGRFVMVRYVSYHGYSSLTKDEATRYLAWLDRGNTGKHFQMLNEEHEADRLDAKATAEKRDYFSEE